MHGLRRVTSVGLVVVAALASSITPTSAAGTTTRWVDDDGHAGPNGCGGSATAKKKIQKAIDASNQDDTVIVCPGTYVEQVIIRGNRDGLTLKSSTPFRAIIKAPAVLEEDPFPYLLLVDRVDDVSIQGFKTITRTQAPCSSVAAAIASLGSKRTNIRGNRVVAPGTEDGVCYQAYGIGLQDLYNDTGGYRATTGTVASNEVRDAVGGGIAAFGLSRQVVANISGNSVRAYFGEPPAGTSALLATRRSGTRRTLVGGPSPAALPSGYVGIGAFGRVRGSVDHNVVQGALGAPGGAPTFAIGVLVQAAGPVEVSDNLIRRVGLAVGVFGGADTTIRGNTVNTSTAGVQLDSTTGATVRRNDITTQLHGILVDGDSSANAIRNNTLAGNGGTCEDDSLGGGSHGTANTWSGNTATVSDDPNGICPTP